MKCICIKANYHFSRLNMLIQGALSERNRVCARKQQTIKCNLPFRLGCTSYVYPDDILPNVRKMAPLIDDVEIVLFESEELSSFPDKETIIELTELSNKYDITYTIHFPTDLKAGSESINEREKLVAQVRKVVNLTKPLDPYGYILHLEGIRPDASKQKIEEWHQVCREVCKSIAEIPKLDCRKVCIENLDYPVDWYMDLVDQYGFSLCLDIGHLWHYKVSNWNELLIKYLPKTRIIHVHGVSYDKDHISLKNSKLDDTQLLFNILIESGYQNVVSIEVFNKEDTFESLELVGVACQR